jgi:hypothetical protein
MARTQTNNRPDGVLTRYQAAPFPPERRQPPGRYCGHDPIPHRSAMTRAKINEPTMQAAAQSYSATVLRGSGRGVMPAPHG